MNLQSRIRKLEQIAERQEDRLCIIPAHEGELEHEAAERYFAEFPERQNWRRRCLLATNVPDEEEATA